MSKLSTVIVVLGVAALGVCVPAASAQAALPGPTCDAKWPGRDGNVRAWDGYDCSGALLGVTAGDDADWGDGAGPFADDWDKASSVMNSGFVGGRDVVAFYFLQGADYRYGYACLAPGELYVDNLSRNKFTTGENVDNNIRSHAWVNASGCAAGSWMS